MSVELYDLGKAPWADSQLVYHALARLGRQALCLVSPASPYVCVGYHQDVEQEVDLEHCRRAGIPVFRREVGGGAVYLDGDQYFFQLVLHRDNPLIPARREQFYGRFLEPVVAAYGHIGLAAAIKPVNDVVCGRRKISGTGVGEIGDCVVFVGNLIVDFDFATMARVLRAPDEKFRDKAAKAMADNMSTIRRELGPAAQQWTEQRLNELLAREFAKVLGPLTPRAMDDQLRAEMDRLGRRMLGDEWLLRRGRRQPGRRLKVRAGLELVQRLHKAPGGLLRAELELRDDRLSAVRISGDIFAYPRQAIEALETALEGVPRREAAAALEHFLARPDVEFPGVGLADWQALLVV